MGKRIDIMLASMSICTRAPRLPWAGIPHRKGGADHQQRVAFHHHVVAGLGAEQADRAGDPWQVVGQRGLAEQRLGAAGRQPVCDRDDFIGGAKRAGADEHRNLLAGIEDFRRAVEIGLTGHDAGRAIADAGMQRAVRTRRDPRRPLPAGRWAG